METWLAAVQEDLRILVASSAETVEENKRLRSVLLNYLKMASDLLIPVDGKVITEQLTQLFGDVSLLLLQGCHDTDVVAEGEDAEEKRAWQHVQVKTVLRPLNLCCVAHPMSLMPSCLLFYVTDYGDVSTAMCKEVLREAREFDVKGYCHVIQDALQYAFTMYKKGKRIVRDENKNTGCLYEHYLGVSRRLAMMMGIQLNYEVLVALFEMMRVGDASASEA